MVKSDCKIKKWASLISVCRTLSVLQPSDPAESLQPWSDDQGRSAKAINRTADMHVLEKSDCAVVPVNQPNKGGKPSAEVGEGRARAVENIVRSHMLPTQSGNCMSQGTGGVRQAVLPPLIHGKSRMRRRARTDLCGGRSVMIVPTATVIPVKGIGGYRMTCRNFTNQERPGRTNVFGFR
jgi:hypothetical protein